jgi:hypothetical protein
MSKFYCASAGLAVFAPIAFAILNQVALIWAA